MKLNDRALIKYWEFMLWTTIVFGVAFRAGYIVSKITSR
jgi:hypothetical protein